MRLLVTGGAGFIGSNFVHLAVAGGHNVAVLDALTYAGNLHNLAGLGRRVDSFIGDICDADLVGKLVSGVDAVVHFAAESHVTRSETDPEIFERTNVEGTRVLIEAAIAHGVKRFVHISTDEVYGDAAAGQFFREDQKEPGDHQATSVYAKSKARADDLAVSSMGSLPMIVVRPTNNFGPYQFPEKAFPRWITRVLRGQPISLWGEGNQVRDWLYAPATAQAVELILRHAPSGEIYNVGANNQPEIRNRDLAHWLMGRLHDHGATIEHQPDLREHHDFRYGVDTSKIQALGWKPPSNVWASFEATLRWYLAHPEWWRPLVNKAESIYT